MSLVSSGIDQVMVFALVEGVNVNGQAFNGPSSVLVKWRSEHEDKLHQVYINGELGAVTQDFEQHAVIVGTQISDGRATRIEVYAVKPEDAELDFSGELQGQSYMGRFELGWERVSSLPFEGEWQVFSNGGNGEVDYDTPISEEPNLFWHAWQDKPGFGLAKFGKSDFGYDSSAAAGFGDGKFGESEFGFGADRINWVSGELETGEYVFAIKITNEAGNSAEGESESEQITIIKTACPVEGLAVESYDKQQDELVLCINP